MVYYITYNCSWTSDDPLINPVGIVLTESKWREYILNGVDVGGKLLYFKNNEWRVYEDDMIKNYILIPKSNQKVVFNRKFKPDEKPYLTLDKDVQAAFNPNKDYSSYHSLIKDNIDSCIIRNDNSIPNGVPLPFGICIPDSITTSDGENYSLENGTLSYSALVYDYSITPFMPYGPLKSLTLSGTIDFSKLNSGLKLLTAFQYYITETDVNILIGLETYPQLGLKIEKVTIEFWSPFGKQLTYTLDGYSSYNGNFRFSIPFNQSFGKNIISEKDASVVLADSDINLANEKNIWPFTYRIERTDDGYNPVNNNSRQSRFINTSASTYAPLVEGPAPGEMAARLNGRDHLFESNEDPLDLKPGGIYYITADVRRVTGNLDLNASFWYTKYPEWQDYGIYKERIKTEIDDNGWLKMTWVKVIPTNQSAGNVFFQIEKNGSDPTTWDISNVKVYDITYKFDKYDIEIDEDKNKFSYKKSSDGQFQLSYGKLVPNQLYAVCIKLHELVGEGIYANPVEEYKHTDEINPLANVFWRYLYTCPIFNEFWQQVDDFNYITPTLQVDLGYTLVGQLERHVQDEGDYTLFYYNAPNNLQLKILAGLKENYGMFGLGKIPVYGLFVNKPENPTDLDENYIPLVKISRKITNTDNNDFGTEWKDSDAEQLNSKFTLEFVEKLETGITIQFYDNHSENTREVEDCQLLTETDLFVKLIAEAWAYYKKSNPTTITGSPIGLVLMLGYKSDLYNVPRNSSNSSELKTALTIGCPGQIGRFWIDECSIYSYEDYSDTNVRYNWSLYFGKKLPTSLDNVKLNMIGSMYAYQKRVNKNIESIKSAELSGHYSALGKGSNGWGWQGEFSHNGWYKGNGSFDLKEIFGGFSRILWVNVNPSHNCISPMSSKKIWSHYWLAPELNESVNGFITIPVKGTGVLNIAISPDFGDKLGSYNLSDLEWWGKTRCVLQGLYTPNSDDAANYDGVLDISNGDYGCQLPDGYSDTDVASTSRIVYNDMTYWVGSVQSLYVGLVIASNINQNWCIDNRKPELYINSDMTLTRWISGLKNSIGSAQLLPNNITFKYEDLVKYCPIDILIEVGAPDYYPIFLELDKYNICFLVTEKGSTHSYYDFEQIRTNINNIPKKYKFFLPDVTIHNMGLNDFSKQLTLKCDNGRDTGTYREIFYINKELDLNTKNYELWKSAATLGICVFPTSSRLGLGDSRSLGFYVPKSSIGVGIVDNDKNRHAYILCFKNNTKAACILGIRRSDWTI